MPTCYQQKYMWLPLVARVAYSITFLAKLHDKYKMSQQGIQLRMWRVSQLVNS